MTDRGNTQRDMRKEKGREGRKKRTKSCCKDRMTKTNEQNEGSERER